MATFESNGLEKLLIDMEELAAMPDSVLDGMLDAGAKVIVEGHKSELSSAGLVDTGELRESIRASGKRRDRDGRYVRVYPSGKHGRKAKANDVGFVHEFGGHGNPPRQWMRVANEKNIDKAVDAESRVYDEFLKSRGL